MARECGDNDMEAFYASLKADSIEPNNVFVRRRPSEETQKEMQILRDFVSKKFSILLHPGRSGLMKDTLKYLLSLPPDEGLSMTTKSVVLQLSQCFAQWSLDYDNASLKLESATADLSKAENVKSDLEANVKNFQEMDFEDKCLCKHLASLQEEKRDLKKKINAIKAEIANSTIRRDMAAKKKIDLFHNGRVMKSKRDDLMNQVPRLKAEQEWAKTTQAHIEAEWSKLGKQFIGKHQAWEAIHWKHQFWRVSKNLDNIHGLF